MKKVFLFVALIASTLFLKSSTVRYPSITNTAFTAGEVLRYRVTYGAVDAGEAVLEVKNTTRKGANRPLFHVVATGKTLGAFNAFYKVHDVYESFIDQQSIMPWLFLRDVNEGGYTKIQKYWFHQDKAKLDTGEKEFAIPMGIQDMISSFYKARTLDFSNMKKGQIFEFKTFMDEEVFTLKIKYVGDEEVKIRKGKFKTHKFVPVVQKGRYFKHEEDVQFWVTADKNKIPLLVKAKIPVGIVKLHLVEWEGLRNDLTNKIAKD